MTSAELKSKIEESLHVIGVIGHRDLLDHDCHYSENLIEVALVPVVREKLNEIVNSVYSKEKNKPKKITLLTSMAKGADQLVAQVASEFDSIEIVCILPESVSKYEEQMRKLKDNDEKSIQFFHHFIFNQTKCVGYYNLKSDAPSLSDEEAYEQAGKFIIGNCDSVLFLWDGVYAGSKGGTSVSYHQAVNGFGFDNIFTDKCIIRKHIKRTLYHLATPRKTNPYPVGKRYTSTENSNNIADYSRVYPYQWHVTEIRNPVETYKAQQKKTNESKSIFRTRFFWAYILPLVIGSGMVVAWSINYFDVKNAHPLFWDKIYEFLKLLKMTGGNVGENFRTMPNPEKIAITIGILLFIYVLVITLIYALANDRRIAATYIQGKLNYRFNLILGLGWKGMELAQNLNNDGAKKDKRKVVVIEKDESNTNTKWALQKGIRVINGNFCNTNTIDKIGWHKAQDIYIVGNDDETNIRALQLLDSQMNYCKDVSSEKEIGVHVHLDDFRNKFFVNKALQNNKCFKLNCFNIYENSIRRILFKHPLDRFYFNDIRTKIECKQADTVKIIILGFNPAAQALFRYCFTHCIYEAGKKVEIQVYLNHKAAGIKQIKKDIPYVFQEVKPDTNNAKALNIFKVNPKSEVGKYVYENFTVKVFELPDSEYGILEDADYLKSMQQNETTSIFACIDDGLRSSAYLSAVLPALEVKKQQLSLDLQVYCYFNFPEEKENTFIEESINKIAKSVPVFFFGNFSEEFTEAAIKNQEQDDLAKLINFIYYMNYQYHKERAIKQLDEMIDSKKNINATSSLKEKIENIGDIFSNNENIIFKNECLEIAWSSLDEFLKESNRLAADHVFIKLRKLAVYIGLHDDSLRPSNIWDEIKASSGIFKLKEGLLYYLAELEHRRWCSERIFYGWAYFNNSVPNRTEWKKLKTPIYEPLKKHIDMLPFDSIHKDEQNIDMVLIEYLRLIFKVLGKYETYNLNEIK